MRVTTMGYELFHSRKNQKQSKKVVEGTNEYTPG